jgi:hypothetical protein
MSVLVDTSVWVDTSVEAEGTTCAFREVRGCVPGIGCAQRPVAKIVASSCGGIVSS